MRSNDGSKAEKASLVPTSHANNSTNTNNSSSSAATTAVDPVAASNAGVDTDRGPTMASSPSDTVSLTIEHEPMPPTPPTARIVAGGANANVGISSSSSASLTAHLTNVATDAPEYSEALLFQASSIQHGMFVALCFASFGVLPVFALWYPWIYTKLARRAVTSVAEADFVLVKYQLTASATLWEECVLHPMTGDSAIKWFEFRKSRHFHDPQRDVFVRIKCELSEKKSDIEKRLKTGITESKLLELLQLYGPNEIDLKPKPVLSVLLRKLLHPFYLFQVASVIVWFCEEYVTYSLVILFTSALSIAWEVHSQVTNDRKLHDLARNDATVQVMRDNRMRSVPASNIVVGDIVLVDEGPVPADLVLISGECTADESTLTGEAIPITKQSVHANDTQIDISIKKQSKECVLYAGSTILSTKADASTRGVVLCAGFSTSKGELFRSIAYPKPITFKIEQDSYRFLGVLSIVAFIAFIKRMVQASKSNVPAFDALISALDLVTIAVPPALPLVLTVGVSYAMTRLERANIFCINSQRINLAGHLDCFCFDKTGTLSSDHLDFQGVDERITGGFAGLQSEVEVLSSTAIVGLATCHGLNERAGKITGYSLEMDMFRATCFSIESNVHKNANTPFSVLISSPIGKTFGVVKRFLFDASLQRSSVLIEDFESGQRVVYTKGSPESIQTVCNPATIPSNYLEKARMYSYQGYYVVALASKTFPVTQDVPQREAMECRLNFVGFVLFLNKIKTESPYVITTLEEAGIDVRIITGDNAFTAIHVARKINMELNTSILLLDVVKDALVYANVDDLVNDNQQQQWTSFDSRIFLSLGDTNEYAITGSALDKLQTSLQDDEYLARVVQHTKIFSRIRPHQKAWIVEQLILNGKCVGMVGDGTNDCGALKAAHVGIALSEADASIVAPFTSRKKQITDVVDLLREGRGALSTSFVAFKYMVLYSVTQVTMTGVMMDFHSKMSNNQFLFDDLLIVFGLSVLMVRTFAAETLTRDMPAKSLFAPAIVCSIVGQTLLMLSGLGIAIASAKSKSWFCSADQAFALTQAMPNASSPIDPPCYKFIPAIPADLTQNSYENSVLWLYGHFSYWIVALAFNVHDVFRKPFYTNRPFTAYLVVLFIVLVSFLYAYDQRIPQKNLKGFTFTNVLHLPGGFATSLFFLFLFETLVAVVFERFFIAVVLPRFQQGRMNQYGLLGRHGVGFGGAANVADQDSLLEGYEEEKRAAAAAGASETIPGVAATATGSHGEGLA